MVDPIDDIGRQARQGSIAAIVQVLNEKLAEVGVRTRAVFTEGVLHLLCEAPQVDQLEESTLSDRVRHILEGISPRNIRRVNINSRIVREQQLLWLEEIHRDPKNQLLWSKTIVLARPNLLKQLVEDRRERKMQSPKHALPKTASSHWVREQQQFHRGIVGGVGLSMCLVLLGFALHNWLTAAQQDDSVQATQQVVSNDPVPSPTPSSSSSPSLNSSQSPDVKTSTSSENFAQAVRLAEQAASDGKAAVTREDWLAIADRWQQASDLMASVSPDYDRYTIALDRVELYRKYSEDARLEADKR